MMKASRDVTQKLWYSHGVRYKIHSVSGTVHEKVDLKRFFQLLDVREKYPGHPRHPTRLSPAHAPLGSLIPRSTAHTYLADNRSLLVRTLSKGPVGLAGLTLLPLEYGTRYLLHASHSGLSAPTRQHGDHILTSTLSSGHPLTSGHQFGKQPSAGHDLTLFLSDLHLLPLQLTACLSIVQL